jgi:ribosomal protein S8
MEKMNDNNFYYWGPLLFRIKLDPEHLKASLKLCSKESSKVNEKLAGVIKHQHYISSHKYHQIIDPYLDTFRRVYIQWYGKPLIKTISFVETWVNFMKPGEFNPPHIHSNCDFSSVLFVQIPEKLREENKKFTGTGAGPGSISFTYGESQKHSISHMGILPEEGDLFIFPGTLTHFVSPFMCNEERISISSNFRFD